MLEGLLQILAVSGITAITVVGAFAYFGRQYFEHYLSRNLEREKVTFTRLHEMRAAALADLYAGIVHSEQDLRDWVYTNMPVGLAPRQVKPHVVLARIRRLRLKADRIRILLPTRSYEAVDRVVRRLEEVSRTLENRDMPSLQDQEGQWEAHTRALEGLDQDLSSAKVELEQDFRDLLEGKV